MGDRNRSSQELMPLCEFCGCCMPASQPHLPPIADGRLPSREPPASLPVPPLIPASPPVLPLFRPPCRGSSPFPTPAFWRRWHARRAAAGPLVAAGPHCAVQCRPRRPGPRELSGQTPGPLWNLQPGAPWGAVIRLPAPCVLFAICSARRCVLFLGRGACKRWLYWLAERS